MSKVSEKDLWKCPLCTLRNLPDQEKCLMCGCDKMVNMDGWAGNKINTTPLPPKVTGIKPTKPNKPSGPHKPEGNNLGKPPAPPKPAPSKAKAKLNFQAAKPFGNRVSSLPPVVHKEGNKNKPPPPARKPTKPSNTHGTTSPKPKPKPKSSGDSDKDSITAGLTAFLKGSGTPPSPHQQPKEGWHEYKTEEGKSYYMNHTTGESTGTKPAKYIAIKRSVFASLLSKRKK